MKALIVQHTMGEGPGLLEPVMINRGWRLDTRCMEIPGANLPERLDGYDALAILGGPMGAYEEEIYPYFWHVHELIRQALETGTPTVGICLGAQIIARALGARVGPNPVKEIGWYRLNVTDRGATSPLFQGLSREITVFEWHQDTFLLPENAVSLATGKTCINQAFSVNNCLWGLQFHPEVDPSIISQWAQVWAGELEEFGGKTEAGVLRERTLLHWEAMSEARNRILSNIEELLHH